MYPDSSAYKPLEPKDQNMHVPFLCITKHKPSVKNLLSVLYRRRRLFQKAVPLFSMLFLHQFLITTIHKNTN